MTRRQTEGAETWRRLRDWDRGQTPSERLAVQVLIAEGYGSVDPSHPLGGPDGGKDIVCQKAGQKWICAVYFPRGQKEFSKINKKFIEDLKGVASNDAIGIAFVTNQELNLAQREELVQAAGETSVYIYHLERLTSILNSPSMYGVRLEFLDIEMTKEEQLAHMEVKNQEIQDLKAALKQTTATEEPKQKFQPVVPDYLDYSILNLRSYHKCSHCGYGYKVVGTLDSVFAGVSTATITCPKCGNTEPYSRYGLL